ncbi:hypothetical protein [Microbacterium abyssi]|uniref:hypothetical protein n=1 Tax=Microbacterium abyssi TaxID=2782166 RepID=UPI001889A649|nr:hypothetical protein [Microbacterium sp. A18JL241]
MTRARIIATFVVATVVGLLLVFAVGVEPTFAIAWGVLAGVFVLCAQLVIPDDPRGDAPDIPAGPERRGTAIARMAWSLNPRTGEAGELITRRVRAILRHRLLRAGLDTDTPADRPQIDALLGADLWARMTAPGTKRQDIEQALEAIHRLSPSKENQ